MLPKGPYNPKDHEDEIYKAWEQGGFFKPCEKKENQEKFSIMMPPPNVTGILHIGHALMVAVEDLMVRYNRMLGKRTLWLPGTDHSAIATQSKVEKDIYKKEKKNRHDLGREDFLKRVEEYAQDSHDTIVNQTKRLGSSCDWSREAFTLDEPRTKAVYTAFKKMYDDGLIYQGDKVINWDPKGQTVISDDEVKHKERDAQFYTFKYSKDFPISISTTRPETKLGDTGVAVHPDDERYKEYVGKEFEFNFCNVPVKVKVIADEEVDPEFGTGALGVTPAHSIIDWEIAERNDLPSKQVIDEYTKIMVGDDSLKGKKVEEARQVVVEWLKKEGLLEKEETIKQNVSTAERTGALIEPLPKKQWFINVNKKFVLEKSNIDGIKSRDEVTLKQLMRSVIDNEQIKILPDHFKKTYFHWIDNLRDWCISRQIWYGHRIPVWYKSKEAGLTLTFRKKESFDLIKAGKKTVETRALNPNEPDRYFGDIKDGDEIVLNYKQDDNIIESLVIEVSKPKVYKLDEERDIYSIEQIYPGKTWEQLLELRGGHSSTYLQRAQKNGLIGFEIKKVKEIKNQQEIYVGTEKPEGEGWEQDPDTLDTWFSAGLWTFSTLGWPEETEDLKDFHPTDVLETGYDIIFFWVARMILMTTYLLGEIPFKYVYLHGLIRDEDKKKMSKSSGNAVDPLGAMEEFGTDALRMALLFSTGQGNDVVITKDKILAQKKFANKIWNASKFVLMKLEGFDVSFDKESDNVDDKEILEKLNKTVKQITKNIDNFMFHEAAQGIYQFFWSDFCDIYLEKTKDRLSGDDKQLAQSTLYTILSTSLKLLHPFMPFITETIWNELSGDKEMLIIQKWPE